jgi:hypothetical protein
MRRAAYLFRLAVAAAAVAPLAGTPGRAATSDVAAESAPVPLEPVVVTASTRWFQVSESAGRVMLRSADAGSAIRFAKRGEEFVPGDTVTTGEHSRFELTGGDGERWRLGSRTAFQLHKNGARLLAGTALVTVPDKNTWTVETFGSQARLGEGTWILQAVENEGVKVICIDGPARLGTDVATKAGEGGGAVLTPVETRMKPGELIFLRPGARGFGPLVTIYLEELLATSRLVGGFKQALPGLTRLKNLGIAQREQLKGVTAGLVAGARGADGFDVYMPPPPAPAADEKTAK